jgi:hypothetical protein
VLLVVIQQEQVAGRSEEGQAAGSLTPSFGPLAGVGQVHPAAAQDRRRAQRNFPPVYASALERQREKDIRVSQGVMIEEITALGVEVVGIKSREFPGSVRDAV